MSERVRSERPVAIVTGAARGIGRGCAAALARAGFDLVLNDMPGEDDRSRLRALAEDLAPWGENAVFPADVADLAVHARLIGAALERWGRLDCLVNNAGVTVKTRGDLLDATPESFDRCIDVDARAVFFLSQAAAKRMIEQGEIGGRHRSIVNVTSCSVTVVSTDRGEYCVAKAGASMVTKLFGLRLAREGIGVYEVRPGIIATEMTAPAKGRYDKLIGEGAIPADRWGQPEDVAATVVCMAEGRLRYTVAQAVGVDGGLALVRI